MSPTKFGRLALKDPAFVFQLRTGRKLRAATEAAVLAWMDKYERQARETPARAVVDDATRILVVQPNGTTPPSLCVYGDREPQVVLLTPYRALELAGDLMQAAVSVLTLRTVGTEAVG